jgi:hypothetical protein
MSRKIPGSLSLFSMNTGDTQFSSGSPIRDLASGAQFYAFTQYARSIKSEPWSKTVYEAVNTPPLALLTDYFKHKILMPWLSSAVGARPDVISRASIRSSLQGFARSFPVAPWEPPITYNSSIGLGGNVEHVASKCGNLTPILNTSVKALSFEDEGWYLNTDRNRHGPYNVVIINAPPHDSKLFLQGNQGSFYAGILNRYDYFDTDIAIHRLPGYVPRERADWSLYNVGVYVAEAGKDWTAEGSVWHRPESPRAGGQSTGIFKSWVTRRQSFPAFIYTRKFKHPFMTPDLLNATRELKRVQGKNGLWFSGHFTTGFDLQESAVFSAMQVAGAINPQSATLKTFKDQIRQRGLDTISYDVA